MSPGLLRVMERARRNPLERQLALAHLIDEEALRRAYNRIRKNAAVGVDGVTKQSYGENLEGNLRDLHTRLKTMKYRHQRIRRHHIPKDKGRTRPIGISTLEDKVVQRALCEILEAIYEQDFLDCSYGFRPGRSTHGALRTLHEVTRRGGANWILEADISSFFDTIDRSKVLEMLQKRIADKSFMRLIAKCLHVGVLDGAVFTRPEEGTVQGSIISPMLGNIYLHYVLDKWFESEVKIRLKGGATLVRYCDDFVICFEHLDDANRVIDVLGKRMSKYGLTLHPDKTRLIDFRRPPRGGNGSKGRDSFDFLGFTIFWKLNRDGRGWHQSMKTRSSRLTRAIRNAEKLCRSRRHRPIAEQHQALVRRIQGHYSYFGVNDNERSLSQLKYWVERSWYKWLNRRSQRSRLNWERFKEVLRDFPFPKPRVYIDLWRPL
ncbi:MAG: group II intron reverse transcriptase/maturase [Proteobacteria bacterium]|nr:group II intron reverse transcriptase/maturase [Pseudomonadota bacterium]